MSRLVGMVGLQQMSHVSLTSRGPLAAPWPLGGFLPSAIVSEVTGVALTIFVLESRWMYGCPYRHSSHVAPYNRLAVSPFLPLSVPSFLLLLLI